MDRPVKVATPLAVARDVAPLSDPPTGLVEMAIVMVSEAEVTVENDGAPISPAMLERIFEPFVRGEGGRKGDGLGLHIVHEIARAHGGEVYAASDAAKTAFTLRLPLARA